MTITEQLQANLKKYREAAHLTSTDLAQRSGVSRAHIWQLEHSKSAPTIEVVERLAMGLGITLEMLLGLNGKVPTSRLEEEHYAWLQQHKHADVMDIDQNGMERWVIYLSPMYKAKHAREVTRDN